MALTITKDNFDAEVLNSDTPVVIDFWASWCGPCKMMAPVIDELSTEFDGKIKIGKIDIDNEPELAQKYGVMSIPTFIKFSGGNEEARTIGAIPKSILVEQLGLE
ncbi:MAG: thioredoxin [Firmicutes bacterium]|nr:thioredoxin [Bacillota bacterium]